MSTKRAQRRPDLSLVVVMVLVLALLAACTPQAPAPAATAPAAAGPPAAAPSPATSAAIPMRLPSPRSSASWAGSRPATSKPNALPSCEIGPRSILRMPRSHQTMWIGRRGKA